MIRILIQTICLILFFHINSLGTTEIKYFISPEGADNYPGTLQQPFKSISKAIEIISGLPVEERAKASGAIIYLTEGTYFEYETIELNGLLKASDHFQIEIKAYEGANPVLHGGKKLDGEHFEVCKDRKILDRLLPEVRGKVWMVNLKHEGINDFGQLKQHGFGTKPEPAPLEIFINGEPLMLARYPNEGKLPIGKVYDKGSTPRYGDFSGRGAEFGFEYDRVNRWTKADDIWLHGKFSFGYNDDNLKVEKINWDKKSFKIAQPHKYGISSTLYDGSGELLETPSFFRGYYAYNILEEIDQPGEYYLDRDKGILYLFPTIDLKNAEIEVSLKESPFFSLENISNVKLEGITFTSSRGLAIYLNNCSEILIEKCKFYNLGTVAVSMGQSFQKEKEEYYLDGSPKVDSENNGSFKNITVSNCLVFNTGTGGIVVEGGDRTNLIPGNILVDNSEFYQTGRINYTYSPAVKLGGVGNKIRNCNFHDIRHQAIRFAGNDHVIEYCRFDRICYDADDMGAIYTGRNPSERGTIIQYNYFSDILPKAKDAKMCGIYIDDGSGGTIIKKNFFYKVGNPGTSNFAAIFFHGGHDNKVEENIFMDCSVAVGSSTWDTERWSKFLERPLIRSRLLDEVNINSDLYLNKYPDLNNYFNNFGRRINYVSNSLLIRTPIAINGNFMLIKNLTQNKLGEDFPNLNNAEKNELGKTISFPFEKVGVLNGF